MATDIAVQLEGTIALLHPQTDAATGWFSDHIDENAQYFGSALVVEHRYIESIIQLAVNDGLTLDHI